MKVKGRKRENRDVSQTFLAVCDIIDGMYMMY